MKLKIGVMSEKIKILLVEDDFNLGLVVQDMLAMEGYTVHLCRNGKEGLLQFNQHQYDLCILDVMMPKKDGFSLAQDIRKINMEVPIIFLTAKSMDEDKIQGFKSGGDDYITKPFNDEVLLLRVKAMLRRTGDKIDNSTKGIYNIGKYVFNSNEYKLLLEGEEKKLTKREAEILKLLCEQQNQVVERSIILNMIWGDDNYFNGRSLDVFITKLRKYLMEDTSISIENIHGIGFQFKVGN